MENSGTLFYVVGPSGVGKDSILNLLRAAQGNEKIIFLHRYITRPANAGNENHIALTPLEFEKRKTAGLFAMSWESHGLSYGLGTELNDYLAKGYHVIMNGSRGYLPEALNLNPDLHVILIQADKTILAERLRARGRETEAEIQERLERAEAFKVEAPKRTIIENNGTLEEAVEQFISVLREVVAV